MCLYVCVSVFLAGFNYGLFYLFSKEKRNKGHRIGWVGRRGGSERVGKGKIMIRIYCLKINLNIFKLHIIK